MAARGEPYMTIFRPAHKNPMTSILVSPFKIKRVIKITPEGNPTSKSATNVPVFA